MFGIHPSTVSRNFVELTNILSAFLVWLHPSVTNKRIIELNEAIKDWIGDPLCTDIIDSTNAANIQKPHSLAAQNVAYSEYYGTNCAKCLISLAPCGLT